METHLSLPILLSILAMTTACGSGSTTPTDNEDFFVPNDLGAVSDNPFDQERLMIVQVNMPASDFEALAWEGRSLDVGISQCPSHDFEYTEFKAKVNIDGDVLDDVIIRKKGYLGSLSPTKPSLKLDFDEAVEGRRFKGLKRMTLNNNRQDPTHARQCLAYSLYEKAGIRVPRCSLAQVYVNGNSLGIYTHVESIKKPFLERVFNDKSGNLYEAQISDFGQNLNDTFQLKTNKTLNDRSDLQAVADALDIESDAEFLNTIGNLIALDEFISYWAIDTLTGNWDSATGNANNYYIYHNPSDQKFHFIPWGLDAAFTGSNILKPNSGPLYNSHRLAKRLFAIESSRADYYARINTFIDDIWKVNELTSYIDKIQSLTNSSSTEVNQLKTFITGNTIENKASHKDTILAAIENNGGEQIDYSLNDEAPNCDPISSTSITASFESIDDNDKGSFTFQNAQGTQITANITWVSLGEEDIDGIVITSDTSTLPSTTALTLIGVDQASVFRGDDPVDAYVLQVTVESPNYKASSINLHGFANSLMLFKVLEDKKLELIATGRSGTISFTSTGTGGSGNPIKGSVSAIMGNFIP